LTDEKKKPVKKAEEPTDDQKKEQKEAPQPPSEEKSEGAISEEPKSNESVKESEKVVETPDDSKPDESVAEPPSEEEKIKETVETPQDEPVKEPSPKEEVAEPSEKKLKVVESEKPLAEPVKITETKQQSKSEEKPKDVKPKKGTEEPKKPEKKKDQEDEDFQYIVRIANTDIDGGKTVVMGIAQIKGIGRHLAVLIADSTGLDIKLKMGKLTDPQIEKIKQVLENLTNIAPGWMLNHRKDMDTGEDIHLISGEVDLRLRDDINLLKMIRSYRGIRHESGLAVRGQRTRANNRRGLALGVSKKRPGT